MKRELTRAAQAAKAIKNELQAAFPGVKFSVTSENYSGGDSVRVHWTDGPKQKDVDDLLSKYEYGHFDGMRDLYEYDNVNKDIPQAKYIFATRHHSEERQARAREEFIARWKFDPDDHAAVRERFGDYMGADREIHKILDVSVA